jgi:hypothetical protein
MGWALLGQWASRYSNSGIVAPLLGIVRDKERLDTLLRGQIILRRCINQINKRLEGKPFSLAGRGRSLAAGVPRTSARILHKSAPNPRNSLPLTSQFITIWYSESIFPPAPYFFGVNSTHGYCSTTGTTVAPLVL